MRRVEVVFMNVKDHKVVLNEISQQVDGGGGGVGGRRRLQKSTMDARENKQPPYISGGNNSGKDRQPTNALASSSNQPLNSNNNNNDNNNNISSCSCSRKLINKENADGNPASSNSNNSGLSLYKLRTSRPVTAAFVKAESPSISASAEEKDQSSCERGKKWNFSSAYIDRDMLNIEQALLSGSGTSSSCAKKENIILANAIKNSPGSSPRRSGNSPGKSANIEPNMNSNPNTFASYVLPGCNRNRIHPNTSGPVVGYKDQPEPESIHGRRWNIMTRLCDDEERMKPALMLSKNDGNKGRDSFYEQFQGREIKTAAILGGSIQRETSLSNISAYR